MDLLNTIETMSPEMYARLQCAAETGKWPEGVAVEESQRAMALQLTMAYQARHLNNDQMLTIGASGEIIEKNKRQLKAEFSSAKNDEEIVACEKPTKADIAYFSNNEL